MYALGADLSSYRIFSYKVKAFFISIFSFPKPTTFSLRYEEDDALDCRCQTNVKPVGFSLCLNWVDCAGRTDSNGNFIWTVSSLTTTYHDSPYLQWKWCTAIIDSSTRALCFEKVNKCNVAVSVPCQVFYLTKIVWLLPFLELLSPS